MFILSKETGLSFHFCGLFEAPSPEWLHMSRELNEYELMIVIDGTLYIGSEEESFEVPEGNYLIMSPTRRQYGVKPSFCRFYWFHFAPQNSKNGISIPLTGNFTDLNRLLPFILSLQNADRAYHDPDLNDALFRSLLLALLAEQKLPLIEKKNRCDKLCEEIKNYIEWNYFSNIRVSDIAGYFGYHEKYISSLFHRQTGITLKQYLSDTKMKYACRALSTTDISVNQLSINLGFSDSHNFSTAFKKAVGMSPCAYRSKTRPASYLCTRPEPSPPASLLTSSTDT